jgi:hypothetical protein
MKKFPPLSVQTQLVSEKIDEMLSNLHEFQIEMFSPAGDLIKSPEWDQIFETILDEPVTIQ